MRIRLTIHRQDLPVVDVLWSIPDDGTRLKSIARLLEDVNDVFPLETERWGFEDYAAHLGKFECLHFANVYDILKEDDNLVIGPLTTIDHRQRRQSGRAQISSDGRHLVDGIAFGRPWSKQAISNRPKVDIPGHPREDVVLPQHDVYLPEDHQDSDDENDAPLAIASYAHSRMKKRAEDGADEGAEERKSKRRRLRVHFTADPRLDANLTSEQVLDDDDDEEEEAEEDYVPGSETGSDVEDDPESISDSDTDTDTTESSSTATSSSDSSSMSGNKSEHGYVEQLDGQERRGQDSAYASQSVTSSASENQQTHKQIPPGSGKKGTRLRNDRRKQSRQLRHWKSIGLVPKTMTISEFRAYQSDKENQRSEPERGHGHHKVPDREIVNGVRDQTATDSHQGKQRISNAQSLGMNGNLNLSSDIEEAAMTQLEAKKKALLAAVSAGLPENGQTKSFPASAPFTGEQHHGQAILKSQTTLKGLPDISKQSSNAATETAPKKAQSRRSTLDLASSKRMVFNALGHRTPRTPADAEKLREDIAKSAKRNPLKQEVISQPNHAEADDGFEWESGDESWREKVNLEAVECCDTEVSLSTPPFPFYQWWDDDQSSQRQRKTRNKKRKRAKLQSTDWESEEKEDYYDLQYDEDDASFPALDYEEGEEECKSTNRTKPFLESEIEAKHDDYTEPRLQDVQDTEEDLPTVPLDPSTLPPLTSENYKVDAVIAFKQFEMVDFSPMLSSWKTAIVQPWNADDVWLNVKLAKRDTVRKPEPKYDHNGNRIYENHEMDVFEEEQEREHEETNRKPGELSLTWDDLIDAHLVA
jgi:hypothetical protein